MSSLKVTVDEHVQRNGVRPMTIQKAKADEANYQKNYLVFIKLRLDYIFRGYGKTTAEPHLQWYFYICKLGKPFRISNFIFATHIGHLFSDNESQS